VGGPVQVLADLFVLDGGRVYHGSSVTQAAHMLQAAARARRASAPPPMIAAALLHDVGHLLGPGCRPGSSEGARLMAGIDDRHEKVGAEWLSEWFPAAVTEPVRLHVAAKRYLCAIDPGYRDRLSGASRFTLTVQGGPMSRAERADFEAEPYARDAIILRRWDESAKDPAARPEPFDFYRPLLNRLLVE
jgi:gamma-butyrobetaine dioxygenase